MRDLLFFRADADEAIGSGHVMRCVALAQAWIRGGGAAVFCSGSLPKAIEQRLEDEGIERLSLFSALGADEDVAEVTSRVDGGWLVVDGRHLGAGYAAKAQAGGARVVLWDDLGSQEPVSADVILNQNIHAVAGLYPRATGKLLLGTRFACLREEFTSGPRATGTGLLVTFGGWPPQEVLTMVMTALKRCSVELPVTVVGGHEGQIDPSRSMSKGMTFLPPMRDMAVPMRKACLAVAAAGSTCWELCYMGIPQVLFALSDDQMPVAKGLAAAGCAVDLGEPSPEKVSRLAHEVSRLVEDEVMRDEMSRRCTATVDGRGAVRVVEVLKGLR